MLIRMRRTETLYNQIEDVLTRALPAAAFLTVVSSAQTLVQPPRPQFAVATVKPYRSNGPFDLQFFVGPGGAIDATNVTVDLLMQYAYGVKGTQISGAPQWITTERYEIHAKPEDSVSGDLKGLSPEKRKQQVMLMLQSLLTDRFAVALHHASKDLSVYVLVVAKNGPKFRATTLTPSEISAATGAPVQPGDRTRPGVWVTGRSQMTVTASSIGAFAESLSRLLGVVVQDRTGLRDKYDFKLQWTPGEANNARKGDEAGGATPGPAPESDGPSLFTAIQEQLGLKLESQKTPLDTIIIDHIERPSEK